MNSTTYYYTTGSYIMELFYEGARNAAYTAKYLDYKLKLGLQEMQGLWWRTLKSLVDMATDKEGKLMDLQDKVNHDSLN